MGRAIIVYNVDYSQTGLGKVTFLRHLESLDIIGESSVIASYQYSVEYNPRTTSETGVSWTITSGNEYATIDENGMLTALSGASASSVTIRATSLVNTLIYDEKTVEVTYVSELLNVHKIFSGTSEEAIETEYKLFSNTMTNWTMFVYAPDSISDAEFHCAVHCMDESGSPYAGLAFDKTNNATNIGISAFIDVDANTVYSFRKKSRSFIAITGSSTTSRDMTSNCPTPVGISRDGNNLYYTSDGENWFLLSTTIPNIENTLTVGAYKDASGNLGRFYDSNGEYFDFILYPTSLVTSSSFFAQHGVKQAFYTLTNHTCDGSIATAINTELELFDSAQYPDGTLLQVDFTLPDVTVANAQTLVQCKAETEDARGFKLTNNNSTRMQYNISPLIANTYANVIRPGRYVLSIRTKDQDYAYAFNTFIKTNTGSITSHNWPLTIGGAMSGLPNSWFGDRFIEATIHTLTIREL